MKTNLKINKREEWMLQLPPTHPVALSLDSISRKFKTNEGPDMSDRSIWTDSPSDKLRKEIEKKEKRCIGSEDLSNQLNNCKYQGKNIGKEIVKEIRCESLLEMHLKTLKKKKKKLEKSTSEFGLTTRRPFDRNVDLQVNRLNNIQKKKIFDKANHLNDRFTSGKI